MNYSRLVKLFVYFSIYFLTITFISITTAKADDFVDLFYVDPEIVSNQQNDHQGVNNRFKKPTKSRHKVKVNIDGPMKGARALRLKLPNNQQVVFDRSNFIDRGKNKAMWKGQVKSKTNDNAVFTIHKGRLFGRINVDNEVYELKLDQQNEYSLDQLDISAFPECDVYHNDNFIIGSAQTSNADLFANPTMISEEPVLIDLLSVYSPRARIKSGGQIQVEGQIQAAVDNANIAFESSNVNTRFRLVHVEEVSGYTVTNDGTTSDALGWVFNDSYVANLRNQHGADMVSFIVDTLGSCGTGYVQRSVGSSFSRYAYQATDIDCAVGNLTFAHEHGHNMGMEHNPENSSATSSSASYPWSFAHYVNGSYRTVMSYSNPCANGCTRVTQFSNPDVTYQGLPTGIANQRDNARTGSLTSPVIRDFRESVIPSNVAPTASFNHGVTDFVVVFNDTSTDIDGTVVQWQWEFGDGASSSDQNPTHTYNAVGSYTALLTVTDNDGATSSTSEPINITQHVNIPPQAQFLFTTTDLSASFTDRSFDTDGTVVAWLWEFGDETSSTVQNPVHDYSAEGNYSVTLTVTDNKGGTSAITRNIEVSLPVNQLPIADFQFSIDVLNVSFTDSSSDSDGQVTSWLWDFGDGTTSTIQNPVHDYSAEGNYNVTLVVTDNGGATSTTSKSVEVKLPVNQPPTADFQFAVNALSVNFTDSSTDSDGQIVSWLWDFGDGSQSNLANPTHVYGVAGSYSVTLVVVDDQNESAEISKTLEVGNTQVIIPNAPTNLTVSYETTGKRRAKIVTNITLNWIDNSDNEQGFNIERCKIEIKRVNRRYQRYCEFELFSQVNADVTSFNPPLQGRYKYRVQAFNSAGVSDYSNTIRIRRRGLPR